MSKGFSPVSRMHTTLGLSPFVARVPTLQPASSRVGNCASNWRTSASSSKETSTHGSPLDATFLISRTRLFAGKRLAVMRVVRDIEKAGGTAAAFPCDIASVSAINTSVAAVRAQFGHIDILVNNAGAYLNRPGFAGG